MKKLMLLALVLVIVFLLTACTAGPNDLVKTADEEGRVAGFWRGLWHGFISPFTFIVSLFNKNINIYEVRNNGGWYNFGFIFGAMVFFGGSGGGAGAKGRRRG